MTRTVLYHSTEGFESLRSLMTNFNLANMCVPHATPLCTIMRVIMHVALAHMFGGINFGDLVKKFANSPN